MGTRIAKPSRYALLLHGMVGELRTDTIHAQGEVASAKVLVLCSRSQLENVVAANRDSGVDVFLHSWNPQSGSFLDEQYGAHLQASQHDHTVTSTRGRSQALSIARAASLMRRQEQTRGLPYELAMVMRIDLFVAEPVLLSQMLPQHIHLATYCGWREPHGEHEVRLATSAIAACPAGTHRHILGAPRISTMWGQRPDAIRHEEVNRAFFTMDWWFAASPSVVATWADIDRDWKTYVKEFRSRGIDQFWGHWAWPLHIHHFLRKGEMVRFHAFANTIGREAYATLLRAPCDVSDKESHEVPGVNRRSSDREASCIARREASDGLALGKVAGCDAILLPRNYYGLKAGGDEDSSGEGGGGDDEGKANHLSLNATEVTAGHDRWKRISVRHECRSSHWIAASTTKLMQHALVVGDNANLRAWQMRQCPFQHRLQLVACTEARGRTSRFELSKECSASELSRLKKAYIWAREAQNVDDGLAWRSLLDQQMNGASPVAHNASTAGYCRAVDRGSNNCSRDDEGSWGVAERTVKATAQACANLCAACARCQFFSYSHKHSDCGWYHSCRLDRLQHDVQGFYSQKRHGGRVAMGEGHDRAGAAQTADVWNSG